MWTSLLSILPWPWRIAICAGAVLFVGLIGAYSGWKGYGMGYEAAENKWMAKIAQLQAEYNARAAAAAQRFNEELKKKTSEAMAASDRFHQEKQEHEDTRASLTKRIDAIANSSTHTFSPAFVRVWNDAELGQLNSAESRVRLAEINVKQAVTDFDRTKKLYDDKLISREEFEKQEVALKQAREEQQTAKDNLDIVKEGGK